MRTAKQIEGEKCPKCGSTVGQCRNGKSADGRQRCKCKVCNSYYTINAIQRAYSEDIRNQAIKAYYSGLSGRKVGQLFGMSKANVYNWIKKTNKVWISQKTDNSVFEMDELFWFLNKKANTKTRENVYIIALASRIPRQIVGFSVCFDNTRNTIQHIVDNSVYADYYATDGNFTYMDVDFPGKHIRNDKDKSDTHNIESINSDLRTYISGLARRSRCFFRNIETLDAVLSLFVDAYNKYGEAKEMYKVKIQHKPGNENKHLHEYKDRPFSIIDFL